MTGPDELHVRAPDELDTATLYRLLALRVAVFVVEQACPYPELDGRDLEPTTRHAWVARDGEPLSYLRVLAEPDGTVRIGRVCTTPAARGQGLAGRLMQRALADVPGRVVVLDAQCYLADWYRRWGFHECGAEFVEDGIPHVPMRREP